MREDDFNDAMIMENSNRIRAFSQEIQGVHVLFQNLQIQVAAQEPVLDNIEADLIRTESNTAHAVSELQQAQERQKRQTKCYLCLILMAALFVGAVTTVVTLRR